MSSLKPIDSFDSRGSNLRNSTIALVLYEMRHAETMGSGIGPMKTEFDRRELPEPSFESSRFEDDFTTIFHIGSVGHGSGSGYGRAGGSSAGSGDGRNSVWLEDGAGYGDGRTHAEAARTRKDDDKSRKDDDKSRKDDDKSRKDDDKSRKPDLPEDLQRRIESLGGKAEPNTVRGLIIDICSVRPFSANELAAILDRSRDHVVREYIKPLVDEGALDQTHPENPRHPKQAYRTIGPESTDD